MLDLGLFASLQSTQYQEDIQGIHGLLAAVQNAYDNMSWLTLDNVFLTLQSIMVCVMMADGGNDYKLPHMGKAKLRKRGALPQRITCPHDAYSRAYTILKSSGRASVLFIEPPPSCLGNA